MCDNCKRAVYELELEWGAGRIDIAKLKGILTQNTESEAS